MRNLKYILPVLLFAFILTACGGADDELAYKERGVNQIYNEAIDAMEKRQYATAAQLFDEVERQHPYSNWAKQAQLMAGYAHYKRQKYDDAIVTLDRFIRLHPGAEDVDYAYYLKAMSFYEQISDVHRDQSMTREAMKTLTDVVKRFPGTSYARDAQLKIDLTRDHLAGKEMTIGRYYQKRDQHLAAINRFQTVVEKYDTTTHVQEALYRLTESYMVLGLTPAAKRNASVLGYNYPGSEWYEKAYALMAKSGAAPDAKVEKEGFFSRIF